VYDILLENRLGVLYLCYNGHYFQINSFMINAFFKRNNLEKVILFYIIELTSLSNYIIFFFKHFYNNSLETLF